MLLYTFFKNTKHLFRGLCPLIYGARAVYHEDFSPLPYSGGISFTSDHYPTVTCLDATSTSHNLSPDLSTHVLASTVFWFMRLRWQVQHDQVGKKYWEVRGTREAHWEDWISSGSGHKSNLTNKENRRNSGSTQTARTLEESKLVVELDGKMFKSRHKKMAIPRARSRMTKEIANLRYSSG